AVARPRENHATAAWANAETEKPVSKVANPNELEVEHAKEWVEVNQK
ncbi:MAG: DUF3787 domain-containing protein, partial [Heliobacteriaceae bacterium]|nr:DUF3787 domain-containing protein [Heliobacteriaceae bacterium]